jgi:hypothetical protein
MLSGAPDGGLTGRLAFTAANDFRLSISNFGDAFPFYVYKFAFYLDGSIFR